MQDTAPFAVAILLACMAGCAVRSGEAIKNQAASGAFPPVRWSETTVPRATAVAND